ncbi:MAG: hypothetical protein H6557_07400 [Lewinellaceae bacterium]|nr:hypothetical protein [Phaeodactylibacter sp.]MCB9036428.1 hypothetical protein [Lewinellaceae bacterium]
MKPSKQIPKELRGIVDEIKEVVSKSREQVAKTVNLQLLNTYWQIGKIISGKEEGEATARSFILDLSRALTRDLGKGFSRSNLFNMRNFYQKYPDGVVKKAPCCSPPLRLWREADILARGRHRLHAEALYPLPGCEKGPRWRKKGL